MRSVFFIAKCLKLYWIFLNSIYLKSMEDSYSMSDFKKMKVKENSKALPQSDVEGGFKNENDKENTNKNEFMLSGVNISDAEDCSYTYVYATKSDIKPKFLNSNELKIRVCLVISN